MPGDQSPTEIHSVSQTPLPDHNVISLRIFLLFVFVVIVVLVIMTIIVTDMTVTNSSIGRGGLVLNSMKELENQVGSLL